MGYEQQPDRQEIYYALGNHDNPSSGETFFQDYIAPCYPNNGPSLSPEGTILSFDWGDCHFTITNQNWDYLTGGYTQEQLDWIEQDPAASNQPYKFVIGQEPAFPQHRHIGSLDADPSMRDAFWQILVQEKVQAFFCGHTHFYSVVIEDGVYQLDSGEARDDHIHVMIAQVYPDTATVNYYETSGTVPIAGDERDIIAIQSGNEPPEANARPDQTVDERVAVTLDGSNSTNPDGSIVSYLWEQTGGTPVILSDPTEAQPTFTAPYVGLYGESLTIQLTVADNRGLKSVHSCIVYARHGRELMGCDSIELVEVKSPVCEGG